MKTVTALIVSACVAFPFAASAQMTDAAYCKKLTETFRADLSRSANAGPEVPVAMAQCDTKPADGIPVLEKALKDAKVTLPAR